MVIQLKGEVWVTDILDMTRNELLSFFLEGRRNHIIVVMKNNIIEQCISYYSVLFNDVKRCQLVKYNKDTFRNAANILEKYNNASVLVYDENNNFINILGWKFSLYVHNYNVVRKADTSILNDYKYIILDQLNNYSFEICKIGLEQGKANIVLIGEEWHDYKPILDEFNINNVDIVYIEDKSQAIERFKINEKSLLISSSLEVESTNEVEERIKDDYLLYEEVMVMVFLFSYYRSYGEKNKDKKFYVIKPKFKMEGLLAYVDKSLCMAKYVKSYGYIPVFDLSNNDGNMFRDYNDENIWEKFYLQPSGYSLKEVYESKNVFVSPNYNVSRGINYVLLKKYKNSEVAPVIECRYNEKLEEYIKQKKKEILIDSENILGVLVRGTDYVKAKPKGHSVQASYDEVIDKIYEVSREWNSFSKIFLATEDDEIWNAFKEEFKDKVVGINQKRFSAEEGKWLQQYNNEDINGYELGRDYLSSLSLLAGCNSFIASGWCNGTSKVIKINNEKFENIFVFEKGIY